MDYAERFVKRKGVACTVTSRSPTVSGKCIITPSTKSGFRIAERADYIDGMMPVSVGLLSGEVLTLPSDTLLIMAVRPEAGMTMFMGARKNADLDWLAESPSADVNNNVFVAFALVSADIPAFIETDRAKMIREDPGILPTTTHLIFIPAIYGPVVMDRVVYNTVSCQVDALDSIIIDGILRLQCSGDTRP